MGVEILFLASWRLTEAQERSCLHGGPYYTRDHNIEALYRKGK